MDAPPVQYVRTSDGYDIACYVAGQGRTLVRTPPLWNHISRMWSPDLAGPVFDALAERFRLVLYDGRGQGLSTRGLPDSLSLAEYVHDLEAVVDNLGIDRFILSGWSYAGIVAIQYAVDHPERVEALVLWNYTDMHASVSYPGMAQILESNWQRFVETNARMSFSHLNPQRVEQVLFDAMTQADHMRQTQVIHGVSGEDLLGRVRVPTLFIASRRGSRPNVTEQEAQRWCAMLPGARLVLFDDIGGFGLEDAEGSGFVDAIEEFVSGLPRLPQPESMPATSTSGLSSRELEVLRLVACGKSNPQIAEELGISPNTVAKHVSSIFTKSGAVNRVEAATYAQRHGLV